MVYILASVLWIISAGRYVFTPATAALAYFFVLSLTPRYVAIGIGGEGLAFTALRAINFTIFALILVRLISRPTSELVLTREIKPFFYLSMALYFLSIVGVFQFGSFSFGFMYLFEDIAVLIVSLYLAYHIAMRRDGVRAFLKYAFIFPGFVTAIFVLIEVVRQAPMLEGIIQIDAAIATNRDFLDENSLRDGVYRAKALFDGALQLGEFATYGFAVSLTCYLFRVFSRPVLLALMGVFIFVIFASYTRSSLLIAAISSGAILATYFLRFGLRQFGRYTTWLAIFGCIFIASYAVFLLVSDVPLDPTLYLIDDARERSTVARLMQYRIIPELVSETPIYGFGYQRNYVEMFESLWSLDNYYLRILLQSGYVGLLIQIALIFCLFKPIVACIYSADKRVVFLGVLGLGVFTCFLTYKLFISGSANNAYILGLYFFILHRQALLKSKSYTVQSR